MDITQYIQKVMLPRWYLTQVVWPWSRTCTKLFLVPWSSICHGVQLGTMWFAFYYAQNGWLITSCVKIHQTASTSRVSDTKILLALEFTGVNCFFFLMWRYHGHKYCASLGVRIKREWQKFGPQWPATVLKSCQHNSIFEEVRVGQLIKENQLRNLRAAPKEVKAKISHVCPGFRKSKASSTR